MQQLCNVTKCENYRACQYGAPAARTVSVEQPFKLLSVEMPNCVGYQKADYSEVMDVRVEAV